MFEDLKEVKKATVKQLIAINAMDMVGFINWLDYGENGTILISWEDGNWGSPSIYSVDKKGLVEFVKSTSHFENKKIMVDKTK